MAQFEVRTVLGEEKAQLVEAAAGLAQAGFQVDVGQVAPFRLPPGAEQQVAGPALVPQGAVHRVDADLQGLNRAFVDAVKFFLLAGEAQAPVALGPPHITAGLGMNPVRADFHALAALDAVGFIAPDPVLAQGVAKRDGVGTGCQGWPRTRLPQERLSSG